MVSTERMATPQSNNDQPLTNNNIDLGALSSISENSRPSLLREQTASPEPIEEGRTATVEFEHVQRRQDSEESIPNSPTSSGPSEEREPRLINQSSRSKTQKFTSGPPLARDRFYQGPSSNHSPRRRSTTTTRNTQNSENSESFAETEVWDQKAILSLGKPDLIRRALFI